LHRQICGSRERLHIERKGDIRVPENTTDDLELPDMESTRVDETRNFALPHGREGREGKDGELKLAEN